MILFVASLLSLFYSCQAVCQKSKQEQEGAVFERLRKQMVHEQIIARGVKDPEVLRAMLKVERHRFVPPEEEDSAYEDRALPIGHHQTISQPYVVAAMTEALEVRPGMKVLEIGTGSGYQAAILAEMGAKVFSIEIVKELANEAKERLKRLGYHDITVLCGDGYKGLKDEAPFDRIIITAAPPDVPQALVDQLKIGGIMVLPVGEIVQDLVVIEKTEKGTKRNELFPVRFVPMVHGGD
jgi:protein-L-isoaspartate(D-aspartate) O-methyltransferase